LGLILDISILIDGERRREAPEEILTRMRHRLSGEDVSISAITVLELTDGIYRSNSEERKTIRREFTETIFRNIIVHPVSFEIAQLAGRVEGEEAAKGIAIPIQDLLIGATALILGYSVVTLNPRHFQLIPGLQVVAV
jgi:predicted nucleic acid-binding protein